MKQRFGKQHQEYMHKRFLEFYDMTVEAQRVAEQKMKRLRRWMVTHVGNPPRHMVP
jgi:hypothetical protein